MFPAIKLLNANACTHTFISSLNKVSLTAFRLPSQTDLPCTDIVVSIRALQDTLYPKH